MNEQTKKRKIIIDNTNKSNKSEIEDLKIIYNSVTFVIKNSSIGFCVESYWLVKSNKMKI